MFHDLSKMTTEQGVGSSLFFSCIPRIVLSQNRPKPGLRPGFGLVTRIDEALLGSSPLGSRIRTLVAHHRCSSPEKVRVSVLIEPSRGTFFLLRPLYPSPSTGRSSSFACWESGVACAVDDERRAAVEAHRDHLSTATWLPLHYYILLHT